MLTVGQLPMNYRDLLVRYMRFVFLEGGPIDLPKPDEGLERPEFPTRFSEDEVEELQRIEADAFPENVL
jgi:hypothetical protein